MGIHTLQTEVFELNFLNFYISDTHTHNHFTALFPGQPWWASARRELLGFMVQGKINRGRHRPSSWAPLHPNQPMPTSTIPHFFTGRMPFLLPNQQC